MYLFVSIELIVCRETPITFANSSWVNCLASLSSFSFVFKRTSKLVKLTLH